MYPDLKNIFLKGPFGYGENLEYRFVKKNGPGPRLGAKNNSSPHLIFTSPLVVLSNFCCVRKYLRVSLDNLKSRGKCLELSKFILDLERDLLNNKQITQGKPMLSAIHTWNNNKYLRFGLQDQEIQSYDVNKNLINIGEIKKGSLIRVMFWLKGLVITKNGCNLQLNILQLRMFDVLPPKQCLIMGEEVEDAKGAKDKIPVHHQTQHQFPHPSQEEPKSNIPEKYRKMLAMGIPLASVTQRCIMDGEDPAILTNGSSQSSQSRPVRPPIGNLLSGLSGVKLNKVVKNDPRQNALSRVKKNSNHHVPSLDDILKMKRQLKRIGPD